MESQVYDSKDTPKTILPNVEQKSGSKDVNTFEAETKSNSLILTDPILLHPENESSLRETLKALEELVHSLNIQHGLESCLQVLHFKSFRRVIMIFSDTQIAKLIYNYLSRLGLVVSFARRDNKLTACTINQEGHKHDERTTLLLDKGSDKLDPNDTPQTSPIDEKMPMIIDENDRLHVPENPIQMQSPPASPYEGWINRPEDPPCSTTIGFHPKTLGHLLYTYSDEGEKGKSDDTVDNGSRRVQRVFSSFIDSEKPKSDEDSNLEDLDLGEGLTDGNIEDEDKDKLKGSLFHNPIEKVSAEVNERSNSVHKIPIVVIDNSEAATLKTQAKEMDANQI